MEEPAWSQPRGHELARFYVPPPMSVQAAVFTYRVLRAGFDDDKALFALFSAQITGHWVRQVAALKVIGVKP
jgi:hypothetical protein